MARATEKEQEEYWKDLPSLKEIQAAIPSKLFERSLARSMFHVVIDFVQCASLIYLGLQIETVPYFWARVVLWPLYWFALGAAATGIWVLAHECGHQGFSPYHSVNNAVGMILHSILLVPYHSWRISHGLHHKYNGHMKKDQVYVPTEADPEEYKKNHGPNASFIGAIVESPLVGCMTMWLIGWPLYLAFNVSGQDYLNSKWQSHFNPYFEIFQPKHHKLVMLSNLGLMVWSGVLAAIAWNYSFEMVLFHYFMPYLWVNYWLVTYTYLQHTDPDVVHFREGAWTFERGSSSTVDRSYGPIFNYLHHHIGDSHVAHHYFSAMPFYNAVEATPCMKKVLGKYYFSKDTGIVATCFANWKACRYVDSTDKIVAFRSQ